MGRTRKSEQATLKNLVLSDAGKVFVREYFKNGKNATAAHRVAFPHLTYDNIHKQVRAAAAYKRNHAVAKAIREGESREVQKLGNVMDKYAVTKEKIVEEFARIAFANTGDYMTWGPDGVNVKPSSELTAEEKAAIAEVKETRSDKTGTVVQVKPYDKISALTALAKTLGMLQDKVSHEHKHVAVSFIIEGKEG